MREEREDNKSEIVVNRLTAATLKYVKGCESAFYFFLAINRNLCYTDYSVKQHQGENYGTTLSSF